MTIGGNVLKKFLTTLVLLLAVFCTACGSKSGQSSDTKITIGDSSIFSKQEIQDAIDSVKAKFKEFDGCTMTHIWYDEENTRDAAIESTEDYGVSNTNIIIIESDFDVDSSGGDIGLNANSSYEDWSWTLTRKDKDSSWEVVDYGQP